MQYGNRAEPENQWILNNLSLLQELQHKEWIINTNKKKVYWIPVLTTAYRQCANTPGMANAWRWKMEIAGWIAQEPYNGCWQNQIFRRDRFYIGRFLWNPNDMKLVFDRNGFHIYSDLFGWLCGVLPLEYAFDKDFGAYLRRIKIKTLFCIPFTCRSEAYFCPVSGWNTPSSADFGLGFWR